MRATPPMKTAALAGLVSVLALSAGAANAPKHPLQGQTIDFIAAESGDDADSVPLTITSAQVENAYGGPNSRGEADMESDTGKDIITFVRDTGKKIAAAQILPPPPAPGAAAVGPKYAFTLAFKEHVVYRMGDNVGPAFAAGFTFGLAAPSTLPVSYVTEITLGASRSDGPKANYVCAVRFKGAAPKNYRPAPALWAKMSGTARDECVTDLIAKMKADAVFFHPVA